MLLVVRNPVFVDREKVEMRTRSLEEIRIDVGCRTVRARTSHRNARVDGFHRNRRVANLVDVGFSGLFVADTPDFDVERGGMTVLRAQLREWTGRVVAIAHPVGHLLNACEAVLTDIGFGPKPSAEFDEFVGSEGVRFRNPPPIIVIRLAILADTLLPVVAVDEAPAGPADDGHLQLLDRLDDIQAEPILVGKRRTGLEEATVDLLPKVLDEAAENHRIIFRDGGVDLDDDARLQWPGR